MSADRAHYAVRDRRETLTRGAATRAPLLAAARVLAVIRRIDIRDRG